MKDIIEWLIKNEERAFNVYERSAHIFSADKEFADFLMHMSREEKEHVGLIKKAAEIFKAENSNSLNVHLDNDTRQNIEDYFVSCEKKMDSNELTKDDLVAFIIAIEYSEWNNLFLYVMNTLRHRYNEFNPILAKMQRHKRNVERFLESHPQFREQLQKIKKLPKIWEGKILVVDDEPIIADTLAAVLEDEGVVDSVSNGKEALVKLGEKNYSAIVSDADMPIMNGIEFYKKAVEMNPNIKESFIFFTGSSNPDHLNFFERNNIKYISKATSITEIRRAIFEIINRGS